jgi:hypothetical protein
MSEEIVRKYGQRVGYNEAEVEKFHEGDPRTGSGQGNMLEKWACKVERTYGSG